MTISFHGAAQTVTGSKHIIRLNNGNQILLDCGLFQGLGMETEDLNANFGFNPAEICFLLLSHAHIDHSGLIPKLIKEGFKGKIYATAATMDLAEILLLDSAEIQLHEAEHANRIRKDHHLSLYEALYNHDDVVEAMKHFVPIAYNEWIDINSMVKVMYTQAGHLTGSAAINIKIQEQGAETQVLYSGDIGRYRSVLLNPPGQCPAADYIILESTYGDKHHDLKFNIIESIHNWVQKTCIENKGKLIIPAFSVGRTQEVLYALNQLSLEKRLPPTKYYIDSPLSLRATQTIKKYADEFNPRLQQVLTMDNDPFEFPGLHYIEQAEDSRKLLDNPEPCVIISASGTADSGRVRHHVQNVLDNSNSAILLVGYCGPRSLGGQLLKGPKEIIICGVPYKVKAIIGQIKGMSAHGDCDDLCRFIAAQDTQKVKGIFLVHGEHGAQKSLAAKLETKGFNRVEIPKLHQEIAIKKEGEKAQAA
ncbi:MAG: MBL fold metallo-hydrolase [Flavisolibacter sp.]